MAKNISQNARQIAIDGKVPGASGSKRNSESPMHIVSAWCKEHGGLLLGQEKTDAKSNEIAANPKLLETLELKGAIVTIDAAGCQKTIARKIIEKEGDYILALKGNQKSIHEELVFYFNNTIEADLKWRNNDNYYDYFDKSYGKIVRRITLEVKDISQKKSLSEWPGVESCIVAESIRQECKNAEVTSEFHVFLSSLNEPNANLCNHLVRGHWSVENQLHWSLDVIFKEDSSRIRDEISG